jgi:hypothetical protein
MLGMFQESRESDLLLKSAVVLWNCLSFDGNLWMNWVPEVLLIKDTSLTSTRNLNILWD